MEASLYTSRSTGAAIVSSHTARRPLFLSHDKKCGGKEIVFTFAIDGLYPDTTITLSDNVGNLNGLGGDDDAIGLKPSPPITTVVSMLAPVWDDEG